VSSRAILAKSSSASRDSSTALPLCGGPNERSAGWPPALASDGVALAVVGTLAVIAALAGVVSLGAGPCEPFEHAHATSAMAMRAARCFIRCEWRESLTCPILSRRLDAAIAEHSFGQTSGSK